MKIQVDDKGWAVVSETGDRPHSDPTTKPSSGVYRKTGVEAGGDAESDTATPTDADALVNIGEAPTEPSIPSQEAIDQGAAPLPAPSALPQDLLALTVGGKVA